MLDFSQSSLKVARQLIGATLLIDNVGGVIVETEAYDESEPASHGYSVAPGWGPSDTFTMHPQPFEHDVEYSWGLTHRVLEVYMVTEDHGRGGALIAIVDDDAGVLESLENLFESCGYCVRGFASAGAFLEADVLFSADCLISDISMPDMDGITLQNRVAIDRPGLPVILITARHDVPHSNAVAANNRGLFHKPVDPFALLNAVAAVLQG